MAVNGHNYAGLNNNIICGKCSKLHIHHRPRQDAHLSEEARKHISEKNKGKRRSPQTEFKKGQKPWNTGKPLSEEHKRKVSETLKKKGIVPPPCFGREPWNKGKKMSLAHKLKLSESHKGYKMPEAQKQKIAEGTRRENHWNWQGGISGHGYPPEWGKTVRRKVRKRDNGLCQICDAHGKKKLDVHHIDSNKTNNELENLIALCHPCHMHLHGVDSRGRGAFQT